MSSFEAADIEMQPLFDGASPEVAAYTTADERRYGVATDCFAHQAPWSCARQRGSVRSRGGMRTSGFRHLNVVVT